MILKQSHQLMLEQRAQYKFIWISVLWKYLFSTDVQTARGRNFSTNSFSEKRLLFSKSHTSQTNCSHINGPLRNNLIFSLARPAWRRTAFTPNTAFIENRRCLLLQFCLTNERFWHNKNRQYFTPLGTSCDVHTAFAIIRKLFRQCPSR